jgi:hypothetical protein
MIEAFYCVRTTAVAFKYAGNVKLVQERTGLKLWVAETVTYCRTQVSAFAAHGLAPAPPGLGQLTVVLSKHCKTTLTRWE